MVRSTKVILITCFVLAGLLLNAVTDKFYFSEQEIKLEFENIKVKDIDFYNGDEVIVKYSKKDDVKIEQRDNRLALSSDKEAKLKLKIPASKAYTFVKDDANCYFSTETMIIDTGDEIVKFTADKLEVIDGDKTKVIIGEDGILVNDEDERVEIGSQGIIVEGDDNTELTGFWGQLLGSFIKAIVKTSISFAGKRPEVIAKYVINDDDDDSFNYSFGDHHGYSYNETEIIEKDYYPSDNTTLSLDNINGSLKVTKWDESRLQVKITKRAEDVAELEKVKILIEDGNEFLIKTEHLEKKPKVSVNYEISLPEYVILEEVVSSNGSIELQRTSGTVNILTSNGSIEVKDHAGDLQTRSSNGKIEVSGLQGDITAVTSNGRIYLDDVSGTAAANTSNASIEITRCPKIIEARTSNAGIELEIIELVDDLDVVTSNAKVTLAISAKLDADLMASTNNGKIIWDHPRLNTEKVKSSYIKGKFGNGGYLIDIRTSNSNVYLDSLEDLY